MTKLSDKELERYSRQILIEKIGIKGQKKIKESSVILIGCGGLGTSAAQYLTMAGIGKIKIIDPDQVELSNLNRQTLLFEEDIGSNKTVAILKTLKKINPIAELDIENTKINKNNIKKILGKYQVVLDCTDNFKSRYLINKFCVENKKFLVSAALQNFDIQAFALSPWKSRNNPCYECIFPKTNTNNELNCDEMGIVAPIAGLGGVLQAILTINIILGADNNIFREFISFDCFNRIFKKIKISKSPACKICKV